MGRLREEFKGASIAYGNGTVYLSDGADVLRLRKHNFDIHSLGPFRGEFWMDGELAVVLGSGLKAKDAVRALRLIIEQMDTKS